MALSSVNGFSISGIVTVMPSNTEDNSLLTLVNTEEREHLIKHTGIRYRRIVQPNAEIKQFFCSGISQLLANLSWQIEDIDVLICVTQSPQIDIPALACQIHGDLGLSESTLSFDINLGCSGYTYGMQATASILASLQKKNPKAILCCGDFSSALIDKTDKATVPIFSDAVSVTGIELNETKGRSFFNLETAGAGQKAIYATKNTMKLNGIDVFNYSLKLVPQHVQALLSFSATPIEKIDGFIFHQANKLINDAIGKRLGIAENKRPSTLFQYGNTASASIPLTLGVFSQTNPCQHVLLCGFGVGFSVGSFITSISQNFTYQNIEL